MMTTLNIAVAEILEKGEISKRTEVELKETDWSKDNIPYHNGMELEGLAYHLVETMKEEDKLQAEEDKKAEADATADAEKDTADESPA